MTEAEVKNLAISYVEGEIVTSMDLEELTLEKLSDVFLPLRDMTQEQREELAKHNPVFLYEYKSKAVGQNQFNSFRYLEDKWTDTFKAAVKDYLGQKYKVLTRI